MIRLLDGQAAIDSNAAQPIGPAIARTLAVRGARVTIAERELDARHRTVLCGPDGFAEGVDAFHEKRRPQSGRLSQEIP